MNQLNLSNVDHDRLSISVVDVESGLLVALVGHIDMQDPSKLLDPFFDRLHTGSLEHRVPTIDVDFRRLVFLNSSGIKALAKWAVKLTMVKPELRYTIRILHDKASTWQNTSLPTLALLVPGSIVLA